MHEQDPSLVLTDDSERVRHTTWHGNPVPGPDEQFVVATANDHLSLEDVPGVIEVIVDVSRNHHACVCSSWGSQLLLPSLGHLLMATCPRVG